MDQSPSSQEVLRCAAAALAPGRTAKFRLAGGSGPPVHGFIANYRGTCYAYVNRCLHAASALDSLPNSVFSEDGRYFVCATHGAVFEPATGVCVEGPCPGARLTPLAVASDGDALVITWPS